MHRKGLMGFKGTVNYKKHIYVKNGNKFEFVDSGWVFRVTHNDPYPFTHTSAEYNYQNAFPILFMMLIGAAWKWKNGKVFWYLCSADVISGTGYCFVDALLPGRTSCYHLKKFVRYQPLNFSCHVIFNIVPDDFLPGLVQINFNLFKPKPQNKC